MQPIDPSKILARHWFQHVVHDVFHISVLMGLFPLIQGRGDIWHCGAHAH
jgi:hypothetical protein